MSNLTYTKVDTDRIDTVIMNIDSSLKVAENTLRALDEVLVGRLRPTWVGDASTTFFNLYAKDVISFNDFIKTMRSLNERLGQAAGIYNNAEAGSIDLVNELRV